MPDFLFEIGIEEIPARMIAAAEGELLGLIEGILLNNRLSFDGNANKRYSTPRRLAVTIPSLPSKQEGSTETLTGPSVQVAFRGGEPTPAAYAFAKKAGVDISQLNQAKMVKGEYVVATVHRTGRSTADILVEQIPPALARLYWPKNMYWRAGKPERFVRPLRWLLALLDEQIVPVEFAGIAASNKSYGHRILYGDRPIEIAHPSVYIEKLESAYVLPDIEARRHKIRKGLDAAARTVPGIRWREDHALVDAVTHLTEWPSALLGSFEEDYLTLPEEVLVTVMRDHQKYFALEDESGKLAPYFLAVLNTQADEDGLAVIRHGNERVLRARFNDARFFWDFDQKIPLVYRVEMLKSVTFHKDLGSYHDRTQINVRAATELAYHVDHRVDIEALQKAALLAKTDLTTELVKEFTELQGIVGGLYARAQNQGAAIADSICWQYRPASADDKIPLAVEGQLLGLADRITTIADMFAIGLEPTGSKDPFALRRAASAIVKILAESGLLLTLSKVATVGVNESRFGATATTPAETTAMAQSVKRFLRERLSFYLRETRNFAYDVVAATLAAGDDNIPDAIARAEALTAVRGSADFSAISAAFKRIKNILRQAGEKQAGPAPPEVKESLLIEFAEQVLFSESSKLAAIVEELREQQKYSEALERIATLRPHVDHFFDNVIVMAPEPELRQNRLALIASVLGGFSRIADFSEIVTQ